MPFHDSGGLSPSPEVELPLDYDILLQLASGVGFSLLESGAEIYRVEESVQRILMAYGAQRGEVFAIPNCLIVSLNGPDGQPLTQMRRMPNHGTDIDRLEKVNDFCRRVCRDTPDLAQAQAELERICAQRRNYSFQAVLGGYTLGTAAFCLFFGGGPADALCGALCGLVIGLSLHFMDLLHTNLFFKTIAAGFFSALLALGLTILGLGKNLDLIIIGTIMSLVPGIAFTNAMRDIIAGDMVSGITRTAEALLIGVAIALGTGLALGLAKLAAGA